MCARRARACTGVCVHKGVCGCGCWECWTLVLCLCARREGSAAAQQLECKRRKWCRRCGWPLYSWMVAWGAGQGVQKGGPGAAPTEKVLACPVFAACVRQGGHRGGGMGVLEGCASWLTRVPGQLPHTSPHTAHRAGRSTSQAAHLNCQLSKRCVGALLCPVGGRSSSMEWPGSFTMV